jgi:hypothetical protein
MSDFNFKFKMYNDFRSWRPVIILVTFQVFYIENYTLDILQADPCHSGRKKRENGENA